MEEKLNIKDLNIFQKMLKATEKINTVAKNLKVDINKTMSYKAVSESDILEAVKPIEIEFGIYSYPVERKVIETDVLETVKEYNGQRTESKQLFMRLEVKYRFLNVDKPEEYVDITTYGDGVDSQDKAPGKAMTYADKYALMKAYKIQTGEDPDKDPSGDLKGIDNSKKTSKATPKQIEILAKVYKEDNLTKLLNANGLNKLEDLSVQKASELIQKIKERKEEI
ncbi:MAG: hypothetical protein HFI09_05110 [Bacilli bacterium]|nr:hypothetical protein [Bacilli bacterium]